MMYPSYYSSQKEDDNQLVKHDTFVTNRPRERKLVSEPEISQHRPPEFHLEVLGKK